MKRALAAAVALGLATAAVLAEGKKEIPEPLTFETKQGAVTFDHGKHLAAGKDDCTACHDKLFKQEKGGALNYKEGMHKKAEAAKTSCASCHVAGGASFESKGNCNKCHVKKDAAAK
jgi:c(7)-type cytochrome triheme protein